MPRSVIAVMIGTIGYNMELRQQIKMLIELKNLAMTQPYIKVRNSRIGR